MKIGMKKWIALLLAAALLLTAAACSLEEKPSDTGYSAKERAKVAVNIGGKYDITKGEIIDQYEYLLTMYSYYGMQAPTADADIESLQDSVIAELVNSKILLYQADKQGITLDDAQKQEVEDTLNSEMQYWFDEFTAQAQSEGATDVDARVRELFNEALANSDMDMDMDEYREYLLEMIEQDAVIAALEASVKAEAAITEEEIQEYYDNLLDIQKEDYNETPGNYATDAEAYVMSGGNPVVYAPKGYLRVKTITVTSDETLDEGYATLRTALDALEAEYGRLMLDGTEDDAERIAEIQAEYDEKKAEADALYEAYIGSAREKINEAYAALEAGQSFDEAMLEFGEDDIYTTYPAVREKGLLMLKEGEGTMDEKLVEAALALENGEYSGIIQLDDMFYIIMTVGDEPNGTTPLADVYDEIKAMAANEAAEALWTARQEAWYNDTALVTYNETVYRDIGKSKS